jgi:hypothetical protein
MLDWTRKRESTMADDPIGLAAATRPHGRKAGKYQGLYDYLAGRYADTIVLTFQQVEDLLGFTLPDLARDDQSWWAIAGGATSEARFSDAWTLASRTAQANLRAQTVTFNRVP